MKAKISYYKETRVETYPYVRDALRETVFNALIHSDWSAAVPVQIKFYDDRVEIGNRCILPEGWTKDNLISRHISSPLNPSIAKVFYRAGYIENWGRGIQKIFDACEMNGAEPPEFDVTRCDIIVTLHALGSAKIDESGASRRGGNNCHNLDVVGPNKPSDGPNLRPNEPSDGPNLRPNEPSDGPNQQSDEPNSETKVLGNISGKYADFSFVSKFIEILCNNPEVTYNELQDLLNVSRYKVKSTFKRLVDNGVVERVGGKRSGRWILKS